MAMAHVVDARGDVRKMVRGLQAEKDTYPVGMMYQQVIINSYLRNEEGGGIKIVERLLTELHTMAISISKGKSVLIH